MRFRATTTALASAGVLGLALASSCGSTPPPSNQQTVAWSAPAGGHAVMIARDHARRTGHIDISNSSCHKEQVDAWQTLNGNKTGASWRPGYNGCLWWIRLHVHCAIPTRNLDYGWFYSGWIVSDPPVDTEVTCPHSSFGITVYLQWKHHTGTTIYHRKLVG